MRTAKFFASMPSSSPRSIPRPSRNDELRAGILKHVIQAVIPAHLLDEVHEVSHQSHGTLRHRRPHGRHRTHRTQDHRRHLRRHGTSRRRRVFSGKDPTKVDRSAAYMARHIAKNVVAGGLAGRCEVQLAYAIGVADPVSVLVETFGTEKVDPEIIPDLIRAHFKLTPRGIIESLNLRRPIYKKTAAYGHFGRSDPDFTWEATDKAAKLASDAGLRQPVAARK